MRGVRPFEALRVQPRGARARLRRRGDRPQPGRRGRHAARQHAAVADRVHRPAVPRAPGPGGDGEEGQAAAPAVRARDRRLRVHARHRLRRRGVPAGGGQHPAPAQGRDEPARGDVAGDEGVVLPRIPRPWRGTVHGRRRRRPAAVRACGQPTTGRFCAFCRARAQILGESLDQPGGPGAERGRSRPSCRARRCRPRSTGGGRERGPWSASELRSKRASACCSSTAATATSWSGCRPGPRSTSTAARCPTI